MCDDALYGPFLEIGELILGIVRKEELDPLHRMPFEIPAVLLPVGGGHGFVHRRGPIDVLLELLPVEECCFVDLFHEPPVYSLSLI